MIKWILLLLVILALLFYFKISRFSNVDQLSKSLYNGNKLNGYRLADVIFYPDYLTSNHKYSTIDHLYKYPDTIGSRYIKQKYPFLQKINSEEDMLKYQLEYSDFEKEISLSKQSIDIDLLNSIIKVRGKKNTFDIFRLFDKDTLFLHIRVGDVLCKYDGQQHSYIYSKKGNNDWWESVLLYIASNNIKHVIIIAGTHFPDCLLESAEYIDSIKKLLNKQGLSVSYRIGNSPDDDLMFCKDAKHFITTGGGYGYFLGKIVELNGGKFVLNNKDTIRKEVNLF